MGRQPVLHSRNDAPSSHGPPLQLRRGSKTRERGREATTHNKTKHCRKQNHNSNKLTDNIPNQHTLPFIPLRYTKGAPAALQRHRPRHHFTTGQLPDPRHRHRPQQFSHSQLPSHPQDRYLHLHQNQLTHIHHPRHHRHTRSLDRTRNLQLTSQNQSRTHHHPLLPTTPTQYSRVYHKSPDCHR